jgi:hypothetical protein
MFTHLVLTAPSDSIAEVYGVQLDLLKESLPCLANTVVSCVSDPDGKRVGSGGGTLNALEYVRQRFQVASFELHKILVIHSGGESRRAPLNSLCGKAWTSVNSVLGNKDVSVPISLLLQELVHFCHNLQFGSLVVASSDVMLDITSFSSADAFFNCDSVSLVTVPTSPHVAKNHGVIIPSSACDCTPNLNSSPSQKAGGVQVVGVAANYVQKPSVAQLQALGGILHRSLSQRSNTTDTKDTSSLLVEEEQEEFALVDSGVVVLTGKAFMAFCGLLNSPIIEHCTCKHHFFAPSVSENDPAPVVFGATSTALLRLDLYTDVMLSLSFEAQTDYSLGVYAARLGQNLLLSGTESAPVESDIQTQALRLVWETMKTFQLHYIFVPNGQFEHLGTTLEVLQLLTHPSSPEVISTDRDIRCCTGAAQPQAHAHRAQLSSFARKYSLIPCANSRLVGCPDEERWKRPSGTVSSDTCDDSGSVQAERPRLPILINAFYHHRASSVLSRGAPAEAELGGCLVEHSVLVGAGAEVGEQLLQAEGGGGLEKRSGGEGKGMWEMGKASGASAEEGCHNPNGGSTRSDDAVRPTRHMGVVSHVSAGISKNLHLQNGIMLQQVYLKRQETGSAADPMTQWGISSLVPVAFIVLGIHDDMKVPYTSVTGTVCGVAWSRFFEVLSFFISSLYYSFQMYVHLLFSFTCINVPADGLDSGRCVGQHNRGSGSHDVECALVLSRRVRCQ